MFLLLSQLIDMLSTLLERPIVHECFKHKYPILIEMCSKELDAIKVTFDGQMNCIANSHGPVINKNMPPVAGVLMWSQELRNRSELTVGKLKLLHTG